MTLYFKISLEKFNPCQLLTSLPACLSLGLLQNGLSLVQKFQNPNSSSYSAWNPSISTVCFWKVLFHVNSGLLEKKKKNRLRKQEVVHSFCRKDKLFGYIFSNTHYYFTQMYAIITLMFLTVIKELKVNCSWKYFSRKRLKLIISVLPTRNRCYFFWPGWNFLVK